MPGIGFIDKSEKLPLLARGMAGSIYVLRLSACDGFRLMPFLRFFSSFFLASPVAVRWHVTPSGATFSRVYGQPRERLCSLPVRELLRMGSAEKKQPRGQRRESNPALFITSQFTLLMS